MNQAALVEAVSNGTIELPQEILALVGQHPSEPKADDAAGKHNDTPKIAAFTTLSEVHKAIERSMAGWDFRKLSEECVRSSIDRARGRV